MIAKKRSLSSSLLLASFSSSRATLRPGLSMPGKPSSRLNSAEWCRRELPRGFHGCCRTWETSGPSDYRGCALKESVTVACAISPESTTVSGDTVAIDRLLGTFQEKGIWARKLKTGGKAYHSHHMWIMGPKYEALLERYWNTANGYHDANGAVDGPASSWL